MEAAIQMVESDPFPRFRIVAGTKVVEVEDIDDAFMEMDFALMRGASRVVIEVIKGARASN